MIPVPSGVQVWLATGHTDMRKGFDGLALLVQETLNRNPHNEVALRELPRLTSHDQLDQVRFVRLPRNVCRQWPLRDLVFVKVRERSGDRRP